MVAGLYFALLVGVLCTVHVEAQLLECVRLTTNCATNLSDVILNNVKNNLIGVQYTCTAVDEYRKCMQGDGTLNCPDTDKTFQDTLKTMNIDIATLCKNTGTNTGTNTGGSTSGNTGATTELSSLLGISVLFVQALIATYMI